MYSLVWTAGLETISNLAQKEFRTTYIGLYAGTFYCLAGGIGSVVCGVIYSVSGPERMFQYMTLLVIISLILYVSGEKVFSSFGKELKYHHVPLQNEDEFLDDTVVIDET